MTPNTYTHTPQKNEQTRHELHNILIRAAEQQETNNQNTEQQTTKKNN